MLGGIQTLGCKERPGRVEDCIVKPVYGTAD